MNNDTEFLDATQVTWPEVSEGHKTNDAQDMRNLFPDFFEFIKSLNSTSLRNGSFGLVGTLAKKVYRTACEICHEQGYLVSDQEIKHFFLRDDGLIGYYAVLLDARTELSEEEKEKIVLLSEKEKINSLDQEVLVKIALIWEDGIDKTPCSIVKSARIDNGTLHTLERKIKEMVLMG